MGDGRAGDVPDVCMHPMELAKVTRRTLSLLALGTFCEGIRCASETSAHWPAWDTFSQRFLQGDGRVVDLSFDGKSTSEGQSYALFFSLVANRRAQFDAVLAWTSNNLAEGRLGEVLAGWLWGRKEDGRWALKDANSASDADLWMAYALLEAARLWREPAYERTARQLLALVSAQEVVQAGRAGTVLLPGRYGFALGAGRWRFNPSYLPGFLLRRLALVDAKGPWQAIWDSYMAMAPMLFANGVAPDNVVLDASGRVLPDSESAPSASYDGIRVYLWAGMSGTHSEALRLRLRGYAALTRRLGAPPEKVDPATGQAVSSSFSPIGFSGALLPYLRALGDTPTLDRQLELIRSAAQGAARGEGTHYYDQVLILFGLGWLDGTFSFDEMGRVLPRWAS
jgi:endoglucanase